MYKKKPHDIAQSLHSSIIENVYLYSIVVPALDEKKEKKMTKKICFYFLYLTGFEPVPSGVLLSSVL